MPLVRRLGHKRGFRNINRIEFQAVSLRDLNARFEAGATVNAESLAAAGLLDNAQTPFKVLASGELDHALTVSAPRLSEAAKAAITAAGGSFEETAPALKRVRNRIHRRAELAAAAAAAASTDEAGA